MRLWLGTDRQTKKATICHHSLKLTYKEREMIETKISEIDRVDKEREDVC